MTAPLTVWCNARFPKPALDLLVEGTRAHRLVFATAPKASNLVGGASDPLLDDADVAFGQPDPGQVLTSARLKWVHLDSAGYTRYDRDDLRAALRGRGAMMTNSSSVYDEPCAQHVMAMMLGHARQLPQSLLDQHRDGRPWNNADRRAGSRLLHGQTALILGYGAIGRRLAELLAPFRMNLVAVRRTPRGDEAVRVVSDDQTEALLPTADHVINILPANASTERFFTADRFARFKPGAVFYNIGRGTTVDQPALIAALYNGQVAAAYLDVTDPEPLPPEHLLWRAPNCFITPHTAGGHHDEFERLVQHFLSNLRRLERGDLMGDRLV
jgi:phosphoglycerate dehydrogenase-like enzyme